MRAQNQVPRERARAKASAQAVPAGTASRLVWVALVVVALSGLIYLPTLKYGFVWDDLTLVRENRDLDVSNPFSLLGRSFAVMQPGGESQRNPYYRPLTSMSLWADRHLWGMNPSGYHLTGILLNALAGLLFALVLAKLFGTPWAVLLGGLAFTLHPMHVESAAWVSGRTDILMAIFTVAAFLALLQYRSRPAWYWLILTVVGYILALLSKETAVVFPVLALLGLGWPLSKEKGKGRKDKVRNPNSSFILHPSSFSLLGLLVVISVAYLLLRASVLKGYVPAWQSVNPVQRVLLVVNAFGRYAFLAVVPFIHKLVYVGSGQFWGFGWATAVGVAALALLVWLIIRSLHSAFRTPHSALLLGSAWFILFILPACNWFFPGMSLLAERALYLPVAGLIILLLALSRSLPRGSGPGNRNSGIGTRTPDPGSRIPTRVLGVLVPVYLLAMGWNALHRMPVWQNEPVLYQTMVNEAPDSPNARAMLGMTLWKSGDNQGAIRELRQAVALQPDNALAHNNLGRVLYNTGDLPGAITECREAVRLVPDFALAHNNLGLALEHSGDARGGEAELRQAIAITPDLSDAHNNLGILLAQTGNPAGAIAEFREAVRLNPEFDLAHYNLAGALRQTGDAIGAMVEYRQAIVLQSRTADAVSDPALLHRLALAHNSLGEVLMNTGQMDSATSEFRQALAGQPDYSQPHYNLGVLFQRTGRLNEAEQEYQRALKISPNFTAAQEKLKELHSP